MSKYQKALNNIVIPLAEGDFVSEHIEDFKLLKELVDRLGNDDAESKGE